MALFLSTYVNKVDRKGRVSVPATFRAALANQRFQGIVVWPAYSSLQLPTLDASGGDRADEIAARQDQLLPDSEEYENLGILFSESKELAFDGEGRVLLPEEFMGHAGITDTATFAGQGRTFQIWEPGRFAEHRTAVRERTRRGGLRPPDAPRAPE